jgi:hypothetical protein
VVKVRKQIEITYIKKEKKKKANRNKYRTVEKTDINKKI